jgi:hypothetical protein
MRTNVILAAAAALPSMAWGSVVVNQQPVSGGGVARWSQLWQDPGPNGNDLDGDSVCWADFTLSAPTSINHIEWWGTGACELGFRIEFWRQDPGTVAYQPLGVFYYGGVHTVLPEARFDTTSYTVSGGPGGINHYVLNMPSPVTLPANNAANPRWFVAIIGLTSVPYATWNWSQGTGGSNRTYQFIRGEGPQFRSLPEGRALEMEGIVQGVCYANCDGSTAAPVLNVNDFTCFLNRFAAGDPYANCDGSTAAPVLNVNDFTCFMNQFAVGCP